MNRGGRRTRNASTLVTGTEQRAPQPKAFASHLAGVLNRARWGVSLAKAFAPHLSLADPNRIKVGVRMRPLNELEIKRGERERSKEFLKIVNHQIRITNPRPPPSQTARQLDFAFDQLYSSEETSATVFKDLTLPLVEKMTQGFNGTIFAYGQTGSGKTHSIMGSSTDPGMMTRAVDELFFQLKKMAGTWEVRASYLQIYREVLHDLLSAGSLDSATDMKRDTSRDLKIRRDPQCGIYVTNLSEVTLVTAASLQDVLAQGNKRRAVSSTLMNAESSRSHAVRTHGQPHVPPCPGRSVCRQGGQGGAVGQARSRAGPAQVEGSG